MATKPKDRSLCSRKAAIGKKPWPDLAKEILHLLARQPNLMHNISYPGSIKSWRAPSKRCSNGKSKCPQLFDIGAVESSDSSHTAPRFVNIFFREKFPWPFVRRYSPPHIWHTTRSHYVGYSKGVVLAQGTKPSDYYILDPVDRCYSMLPAWDVNIPFRFAVLSVSPFTDPFNSKSCIMVLTGNSSPAFAVYRKGEGKYAWERHDSTIVDPHDSDQQVMKFSSAIALEGKFYALSLQGTLAVMEDINSRLIVTVIGTGRAVPSLKARHFRECLLESNGEILLIFLIYQKSITMVDQVEVFRLHLPRLAWVEMESLGETAVFVEPECCLWIKASKAGCKSNCVYFTQGGVDDWWMYDMKNGSISTGWFDSNFISEE